jgi:hypothetical protein
MAQGEPGDQLGVQGHYSRLADGTGNVSDAAAVLVVRQVVGTTRPGHIGENSPGDE